MSAKKIVVLISGGGTNLQAVIDQIHQTQSNASVVGVISNKADAYGLERAKEADIPAILVPSKGINSREEYDAHLAEAIDKLSPDLIVLAGFMRILTGDFVHQFEGKMINIHPSLLPKYQGLHTHKRVIEAGDSDHGASVHFVTEELDGGPVVLQAKVPVFLEDNEDDLAARVLTQEHRIYPLVIEWFINDRLTMQNGNAVLDGNTLPAQGYAND